MCTQNLITRFFGMKENGPDPFGAPLVVIGEEAEGNPFRFSTKYADDETGLVYYGYRYYSPSLARWLSRDRRWEEGGVNLCSFCGNAPVSFLDPNGEDPVTITIVFGGVVYYLSVEAVAAGVTMTAACCCYLGSEQGQQDMRHLAEGIVGFASDTCEGVADFAKDTYEKAKEKFRNQFKKDPPLRPGPPENSGPIKVPEPEDPDHVSTSIWGAVVRALGRLREAWCHGE